MRVMMTSKGIAVPVRGYHEMIDQVDNRSMGEISGLRLKSSSLHFV
jgi:hypothetical protein